MRTIQKQPPHTGKALKKSCISILLAVLFIGVLAPVAHAKSSKKLEFLLRFYDLNEAAFAYHRHCLSTTEGLNHTFLRTLEFVTDELFSEAKKNDPEVNPDYIKAKILERRYNEQYRLDHAHIKEGCSSQAAIIARQHYQEFSKHNESAIRKLVDEQTGS